MLGGWSKPKFYTKCKSALRHTRTRLEHVKKKRVAVEKFLKTDIADLLRGGFHYNAYLKADMLVMEQNVSACYDFVEQFCGCISDHLSDMVKQKECPEECLEAAGSLVYAAARFADLPELRQLRTLFTSRYGTNLESFANKEFVDKFKAKPRSKDTKLELMQHIAQELSIDWDSKALEQKLFTPPNDTNNYKDDVTEENELVTDCRSEHDDSQTQTQTQTIISSSDDTESKRPFYYRFIRPPYTKSRSRTRATTEEARESEQSSDETKARSVTKNGDGEERIVDRFVRYCSKKWSENSESRRGHRATKSESSVGVGMGGHAIVHPNLPDYDQLPARVAALRGIYQT